MQNQKTLVGGFIENLAESCQQQHSYMPEPSRALLDLDSRGGCPYVSRGDRDVGSGGCFFHLGCSTANRVATNGDSFTLASLRPESTWIHTMADSININAIMKIKTPVTTASSLSLKIKWALPRLAANIRACDKNPIRTLGSNILCQDA